MPSTPQAATLDQMSRNTGSNMIVRSAAGSFNEMDEHLTTDYSSKTGRYGWISRPTGLIHAVPSAYLRLTITMELMEASHKTCGGIDAPAHSTRIWSRPHVWRAQRNERVAFRDQTSDQLCQLDPSRSSTLLFSFLCALQLEKSPMASWPNYCRFCIQPLESSSAQTERSLLVGRQGNKDDSLQSIWLNLAAVAARRSSNVTICKK